jgi:tetratricopeptide (TPR) repeat protein
MKKQKQSRNDFTRLKEVESLLTENEEVLKSFVSFIEWYEEGKRLYASGDYEKAIRHLKLGRGKHGVIVEPYTALLEYLKAFIKTRSIEDALELFRQKHELQSRGSTIKYIRRAWAAIKKQYPTNPEIKKLLKNIIPGNPTNRKVKPLLEKLNSK